jgi:hypothetical protein
MKKDHGHQGHPTLTNFHGRFVLMAFLSIIPLLALFTALVSLLLLYALANQHLVQRKWQRPSYQNESLHILLRLKAEMDFGEDKI